MTDAGATAPAVAAGPGARLKAERERRGLSLAEVADKLHIDPKMVTALEAGDYASFNAPVYARGFLRQYAVLLELDAEAIVTAAAGLPPPPPLVPDARAGPPHDWRALRRAALAVGAGLVVAGIGVWLYKHPLTRRRAQRAALPPKDAAAEPPPAPIPAAAEQPLAPAEPPAAQAPPPARPSAAAPTASTPARASATRAEPALELLFVAECWTEVYAADGRRLFYDLGRPGESRRLDGPAPWRLALGNPQGVRLTINGHAVAIPEATGAAQALKVTIDADGTAT